VSGDADTRPDWLRWAQRLQAIAQTGLTYAAGPYDRERYEELRAIAVEMASFGLSAPPDEVRVAFASSLGYPTPKVDVRAVVFRDGEVLLVRERKSGRWTFPGGGPTSATRRRSPPSERRSRRAATASGPRRSWPSSTSPATSTRRRPTIRTRC